MPVLFEFDNDVSDLVVEVAEQLFKEYDFNSGQQSIINSANIQSNVVPTVSFDYRGRQIFVSSELNSYDFKIDVSHPEAVDQAIEEVTRKIDKFVNTAFVYDYETDVAFTQEEALQNLEKFDSPYRFAARSIGLFI